MEIFAVFLQMLGLYRGQSWLKRAISVHFFTKKRLDRYFYSKFVSQITFSHSPILTFSHSQFPKLPERDDRKCQKGDPLERLLEPFELLRRCCAQGDKQTVGG